jgi:RNA-binding protein YlmH
LDSVTHTLKLISRIKMKERIRNKRIYLNWSRLISYSYAKMGR